ncbi:MAG: hypothetical protein HQK51_20945, partial [Oligoflexia bacterium]|nr:hypothetical protein [Oligoflexia bacterium]
MHRFQSTIILIFFFFLALSGLIIAPAFAATNLNLSNHNTIPYNFFSNNSYSNKSITPLNQAAGKWMVTISIGKHLMSTESIVLGRLLLDKFSTEKGGLYQHAIDMDDMNLSKEKPSKANVYAAFNQLKLKISDFKLTNPQAKTMLLLGITAHGGVDDSGLNYRLELYGYDTLSGKEIVDLLAQIKADEIVLIINSCHSGALATNHFTESWNINMLSNNLNLLANQRGINLAVITPISYKYPVRVYTWEEILTRSFSDDAADINHDQIITYEEWKNLLLQLSYKSKYYLPLEANASNSYAGIDPQFYDHHFPADTPFLLTKEGMQLYKLGKLAITTSE